MLFQFAQEIEQEEKSNSKEIEKSTWSEETLTNKLEENEFKKLHQLQKRVCQLEQQQFAQIEISPK